MSKYSIEGSTLSAIGDAIRNKTGTSNRISPGNMPQAILDIPSGGGTIPITLEAKPNGLAYQAGKLIMDNANKFDITVQEKNLSTNAFDAADGFFAYNDSVSKSNFTYLKFKRYCSDGEVIRLGSVFKDCGTKYMHPFEYINTKSGVDSNSIKILDQDGHGSTFSGCCCLTLVHPIKGKNPFSENFDANFLFKSFMGDFIDPEFLYEVSRAAGNNSNTFMFYQCDRLKEITNLACLWVNEDFSTTRTNRYGSAFMECARCERLTFHMNEDGTPEVAPWDDTTIDLTYLFGWENIGFSSKDYVGYNDGYGNPHNAVPYDNRVYDINSYNAHKDDYYYWAYAPEWSRYNHDRAVETINSLPDTLTGCRRVASKGADYTPNNKIKFKGASGSGYGKAISDLTEAEIAVATAKGWQVVIE